jgi:hypothetical protein
MQRLLHPEQEDEDSPAEAIIGMFAKTIAPRMGRAPLAAFLKN